MCGIFGIHEHRNPPRAPGGDRARHHLPGDGPLEVVGHEDDVGLVREAIHVRRQRLLRVAGHLVIALVVDPRHLLVPCRHDPELRRGPPRRVLDEPRGADAAGRQQVTEPQTGGVGPGEADQFDLPSERPHVVGDVGGAARTEVVVVVLDDRDGRLRRHSVHAADDELIEHDVAHDQYRGRREGVDRTMKAVEGRGHSYDAGAGADDSRAAAHGSVSTMSRVSRNSESPKLYSKSPADSAAASAPRAAADR